MKLEITLNGTDQNRFLELYGFRINPFPRYELPQRVDLALRELAAEPIPNIEYIQNKMKGLAHPSLIKLMCDTFRKDLRVSFSIEYDENTKCPPDNVAIKIEKF